MIMKIKKSIILILKSFKIKNREVENEYEKVIKKLQNILFIDDFL